MSPYQYRDPYVKGKRVSGPSSLYHEIPISEKEGLFSEMGFWFTWDNIYRKHSILSPLNLWRRQGLIMPFWSPYIWHDLSTIEWKYEYVQCFSWVLHPTVLYATNPCPNHGTVFVIFFIKGTLVTSLHRGWGCVLMLTDLWYNLCKESGDSTPPPMQNCHLILVQKGNQIPRKLTTTRQMWRSCFSVVNIWCVI